MAWLPPSGRQGARCAACFESAWHMSYYGRSSKPAFRIFTLILDPAHTLHRTTKAACQDASQLMRGSSTEAATARLACRIVLLARRCDVGAPAKKEEALN